MNFKTIFDIHYLKENVKKSKGILALCFILFPILEFLYFWAVLNQPGHSLAFVSMLTIIGLFVIPILLSFSLFGHVYKRKTVDLWQGLPISRITMFLTNTIGGILLILCFLLFTSLLLGVVTMFQPVVSFGMILDYFCIFTVSYIMVFTVTNLCMTVSGNKITQIILTLLLLFMIPFCYDVQTNQFNGKQMYGELHCQEESCIPEAANCFKDQYADCQRQQEQSIYPFSLTQAHKSFSLPYTLIKSSLVSIDDFDLYRHASFGSMIIVSLLSIGIGLFLFTKRKMETCEMTFASFHVHTITKCITMLPFALAFYYAMRSETSIVIFLFGIILLLIYFIVYDLITQRNMKRIGLSLFYFVFTIIVAFGWGLTIDFCNHEVPILSFTPNNVSKITIDHQYISTTDDSGYWTQEITNPSAISEVLSNITNNIYATTASGNMITAQLTILGKTYETDFFLDDRTYQSMMEMEGKNSLLEEALQQLDFDDVYAVSYGAVTTHPEEEEVLFDLLKKAKEEERVETDVPFGTFRLYTYENHRIQVYDIPCNYNAVLEKHFTQKFQDQATAFLKQFSGNPEYITFTIADVNYTLLDSHRTYQFLKEHLEDTCDLAQEYERIRFWYQGKTYYYVTNEVEEVLSLVAPEEFVS